MRVCQFAGCHGKKSISAVIRSDGDRDSPPIASFYTSSLFGIRFNLRRERQNLNCSPLDTYITAAGHRSWSLPTPTRSSPMTSKSVEGESTMTSATKGLPKKPSTRCLNATSPLGGRPKATGSLGRSATVSHSPSPNPQTARTKRPLPCPPPLEKDSPHTTPRQDVPVSPPPTERRRVVKPLPVPLQKIEPMLLGRPPPIEPLPPRNPQAQPTLTSPPRPTPSSSISRSDPKKHEQLAGDKTPKKASAPRALELGEADKDVVQLHKRLIINRPPLRLSLDSDNTSEDEYDEGPFGTAVVLRDAPQEEKNEEEELHADYAWVLSNRILYRQSPSETRHGSKWIREKKGKRYTEEDFENILKALRSL
ncbi:hypothetical protein BDZ97DRAFT_1429308 [Flammula alnicola]|nr:hypothetical protein BDZ97DRAFT_1429308 [Flammula alnicola]